MRTTSQKSLNTSTTSTHSRRTSQNVGILNDNITANLRIHRGELETFEPPIYRGSGASRVVKGKWKGQEVAVKERRYKSEEEIKCSCLQLNATGTLRFANICTIHGGCVVTPEEVWIVMEYIPGGNLRQVMDSMNEKLNHTSLISFAIQATKAVKYLHKNKLIHRDIKSHNFLVKDGDTLLLTDLDTSIDIPRTSSSSSSSSSSSDSYEGTVAWTAPEIIKNINRPIWSKKTDIYSLGMVFYELVSGDVPYKGQDLAKAMQNIRKGIYPSMPEDCPSFMLGIILECIRPNARKRPTTSEILNKLNNNVNWKPSARFMQKWNIEEAGWKYEGRNRMQTLREFFVKTKKEKDSPKTTTVTISSE